MKFGCRIFNPFSFEIISLPIWELKNLVSVGIENRSKQVSILNKTDYGYRIGNNKEITLYRRL